MSNRIFLITINLLLLISINSSSQTSTVSPYSIFGLGEIDWTGSGKTKILGGTGLAFKSEGYLNNLNPASYSALDSNRFIFEASLQASLSYYKSYELTLRNSTTNFNYLGFGFQATKWWKSGVGIKPLSHIGYNISVEKYIEGTNKTYYTQFTGSGDITQLYWGNAFSVVKNLSLGINASYLFGPINQEERIYISAIDGNEIISRNKHVSGFYYDFGLQYEFKHKKHRYTLGLVYGPQKKLKTTYTLSQFNDIDTLTYEEPQDGVDYSMPQKFGAGLAIENSKKSFLLGADYQYEEWEKVPIEEGSVDLKNSQRLSIGLQLQPDAGNKYDYLKRMKYMVGAYYVRSNLQYNGLSLDERAITVGLGLPIKDKSEIYIGVEAGRRGQYTRGVIQEDFYNFHLTFALQDIWFNKVKYK